MPSQMPRNWRQTMREWAAEFRSAARADNLSIFRDHLRRLGLPNRPGLLLEDSIQIVIFSSFYAALQGQKERFLDFLRLQRYDPNEAPEARYALTFDIHGKSSVRLLVDSRMSGPDLADLYAHHWDKYKRVGYEGLWITRADGRALTKKDKRFLERQVRNDIRFDYPEDEVDLSFDDSLNTSALFVAVEDHLEPDENGDTEAPGFLLAQLRYLGLLNFMERERLSVENLGGRPAFPY